jgi:hypothetical protein
MTWLLALASLCVSLPGADGPATLRAAGVTRLCDETTLASREPLPVPGVTARPGLASPTRIPWIVASGWRFMRHPQRQYVYDVPAGKGPLAVAEAFAYGVDAAVKIDRAEISAVATLLTFLERLPAADLPAVADLGIVDDGSAVVGEVMNLFARRNLLYEVVSSPSPRFKINVALGTPDYPREDAADPSAFALKIRRQLGDSERSLRVFGSEVVIGRLTAARGRARLHLINYGGRDIQGLRVHVRGMFPHGNGHSAEEGRFALQDHSTADGATEFSIPRLVTYAVIDLDASPTPGRPD